MKRILPFLLIVCAAVVISALLPAPKRAEGADAGQVARTTGIRLLGATRGYATTALWLRAGDAYRRGDLYETLAAYDLIRELQPRNPAVYSYLAWNQAYNISAQFPERERRAEWVIRGLETLHEGQHSLPDDASLRLDEWNFILNRSGGYPSAIMDTERKTFGEANPVWNLVVETALGIEDSLSAEDAAALDVFLDEVGLQLDLFDKADTLSQLPEEDRARLLNPAFEELSPEQQGVLGEAFPPFERFQLRALFGLSPDILSYLALAHWARLHAMVLAITPGMQSEPHGLDIEAALLNSVRLAARRLPPILGTEAEQEFVRRYKEAVANAFLSGIENALRIGGRSAANEFVDAMRINFEDQPDLLPPEMIDRAHQEIEE
ncbi:MAG: hypothetical protein KDB68_02770 [Planctomycetes bacterium]|nr:hypothetical protein [Planctomycetota bacterium]